MSKREHVKFQGMRSEMPIVDEVVEPVMEEAVEVSEPEVESSVEPEPVYGYVTECIKLNVRKMPNANAEIICTIPINTEVVIDEANSTVGFYKICTNAGVEGFCMKKYIAVK